MRKWRRDRERKWRERTWRENEEIERENGEKMRKWRCNGEKEKTWRGSKSLSPFLPLSQFPHSLTISFPFSRLLSICSPFSHSLAIFSEAASQLPSNCAGLGSTIEKWVIRFPALDSSLESKKPHSAYYCYNLWTRKENVKEALLQCFLWCTQFTNTLIIITVKVFSWSYIWEPVTSHI